MKPVVLSVMCFAVTLGCRPNAGGNAVSLGGSNRTNTWSWPNGENGQPPVPGIDEARYHAYGTYCVIWTDAKTTTGETKAGPKGYEIKLEVTGLNDKTFQVYSFTPDGKTGTVTIDGKDYDVAAGRMFLIATTGSGRVVIQQLDRDFTKLLAEDVVPRDFARAEPAIRDFFQTKK